MKPEIKERVERIRKGEVPEGYKKTKGGIVPEDWTLDNLKIHVSSFIVPMRDKPKIFSGDVPWCRIEDFQGKYLEKSLSNQNVSKETIDEMNLKVYPKGTVLCSCSARLGICTIVRKPLVTNQTFIGLVPKEKLDSEFLYYFMGFKSEKLQRLSSGTTISYLSREEFENFPITYTSIEEQQKISKILSTWDKAIELKESLIEDKKKFKKGLMQKLLTGETRFPEFTDEWDEKKIGIICEIKKGIQINKTELSLKGKYAVLNGGISPSGYTTEWNTKENTITISEGGNSCGFVNFNKEKFWCGGHCYALTNVKINNLLLYYILKYVEKKIMQLRVGSGLPNIQKKDVINFRLLIPNNVKEQEKIAQILDLISTEIVKLTKELNQIKEQKRGLMQLLLTGIVRVEVN